MHSLGEAWKRAVLQDFTCWLEYAPEESSCADNAVTGKPDLRAVYSELAALRQELRLQSREQARASRNLENAAESFQTTADLFRGRSEDLATLESRVRAAGERACLLPLLDVRDALVRGRNASRKVAGKRTLWRRRPRGIEGIVEGYEMALERFDRALSQLSVSVIETLGQSFDPRRMTAVESRCLEGIEEGVVVEEFASGFVRGEEVLRPARVAVNRRREEKI